jgi:hypothetical protein
MVSMDRGELLKVSSGKIQFGRIETSQKFLLHMRSRHGTGIKKQESSSKKQDFRGGRTHLLPLRIVVLFGRCFPSKLLGDGGY